MSDKYTRQWILKQSQRCSWFLLHLKIGEKRFSTKLEDTIWHLAWYLGKQPLVNLLTSVHPWLSSREVAARALPVKFAFMSLFTRLKVQDLTYTSPCALASLRPGSQGSSTCNVTFKLLKSQHSLKHSFSSELMLESPCNGAASAPWVCQQLTSQRHRAEPLIFASETYFNEKKNLKTSIWRKFRPADAIAVQLPRLSHHPAIGF